MPRSPITRAHVITSRPTSPSYRGATETVPSVQTAPDAPSSSRDRLDPGRNLTTVVGGQASCPTRAGTYLTMGVDGWPPLGAAAPACAMSRSSGSVRLTVNCHELVGEQDRIGKLEGRRRGHVHRLVAEGVQDVALLVEARVGEPGAERFQIRRSGLGAEADDELAEEEGVADLHFVLRRRIRAAGGILPARGGRTRRSHSASNERFMCLTLRNGRSSASTTERSPRWRSDQIHVRRGSGCRIGIVIFVKRSRTKCSPAGPRPRAASASAVNSDIHRSRTFPAVVPSNHGHRGQSSRSGDAGAGVVGVFGSSRGPGGAGPRRVRGGVPRPGVSVLERA